MSRPGACENAPRCRCDTVLIVQHAQRHTRRWQEQARPDCIQANRSTRETL
jgi:hypothetical protein